VSQYAASKKAELAGAAERIFSGNFIGEAEAKARAGAWVPDIMRFGCSEVPHDDEAANPIVEEQTSEIAEKAACPLLTGAGHSAGGPSLRGRAAFLRFPEMSPARRCGEGRELCSA